MIEKNLGNGIVLVLGEQLIRLIPDNWQNPFGSVRCAGESMARALEEKEPGLSGKFLAFLQTDGIVDLPRLIAVLFHSAERNRILAESTVVPNCRGYAEK